VRKNGVVRVTAGDGVCDHVISRSPASVRLNYSLLDVEPAVFHRNDLGTLVYDIQQLSHNDSMLKV
jgi:hypothetical protein